MAGDLDSSRSRVIGEEVGYGTKWLVGIYGGSARGVTRSAYITSAVCRTVSSCDLRGLRLLAHSSSRDCRRGVVVAALTFTHRGLVVAALTFTRRPSST
jgi:hypothetical protein